VCLGKTGCHRSMDLKKGKQKQVTITTKKKDRNAKGRGWGGWDLRRSGTRSTLFLVAQLYTSILQYFNIQHSLLILIYSP